MTSRKDKALFAIKLSKIFPGISQPILVDYADKLCRDATRLHTIAEIQCSHAMNEEETARVDKREEQAEARIRRYCTALTNLSGTKVEPMFLGDPRGAVVKLTLPENMRHHYDCFGNEGVCVP